MTRLVRHSRGGAGQGRRGLTMVELVLAAGLGVLVMTGVFSLLTTSLDLWTKGESRRNQVERSGAVLQLLAKDLRGASGGSRGDFLVDWKPFDVDGDRSPDRVWPRMRFVRQGSEAELARLYLESLPPADAERLREEGFLPAKNEGGLQHDPPPPTGLVEVCWAVLPAGPKEAIYEGVLMRGLRYVDESLGSFMDSGFFDSAGKPPTGTLDEVTGGVLWFQPLMATGSSQVGAGWIPGTGLADVATAWDARNADRPDADQHAFNELPRSQQGPGLAGARSIHLPRSVRLELEFESERERRRRPLLAENIEASDVRIEVTNGADLPREEGAHIMIGGEWMVVVALDGDRINVQRGARATLPASHAQGARLHYGRSVVTEVSLPMYQQQWNR